MALGNYQPSTLPSESPWLLIALLLAHVREQPAQCLHADAAMAQHVEARACQSIRAAAGLAVARPRRALVAMQGAGDSMRRCPSGELGEMSRAEPDQRRIAFRAAPVGAPGRRERKRLLKSERRIGCGGQARVNGVRDPGQRIVASFDKRYSGPAKFANARGDVRCRCHC